jgi:hypothetical protein
MGKLTVNFTLRLDEATYQSLAKKARRHKLKIAPLLRMWIDAGLDDDTLDAGLADLGSAIAVAKGIESYKQAEYIIGHEVIEDLRILQETARDQFVAWHPYRRTI